jgi:hypothetical protein
VPSFVIGAHVHCSFVSAAAPDLHVDVFRKIFYWLQSCSANFLVKCVYFNQTDVVLLPTWSTVCNGTALKMMIYLTDPTTHDTSGYSSALLLDDSSCVGIPTHFPSFMILCYKLKRVANFHHSWSYGTNVRASSMSMVIAMSSKIRYCTEISILCARC